MNEDNKHSEQKWGWMIVFGNIICFFVFPGHVRSFGIFVLPIQTAFGVNIATIGSIQTARGIAVMLAVLTSAALTDRFTERKVVIVASVVHLLVHLIVFFVHHIISFYLWAIISGICFGYTIIPTQMIIGKYFGKRRSLAISVCSCGGTLGQLILPPLCAVLMREYSLFGTFLIIGAISFNCAAAGAIQRPINLSSKEKQNGDSACQVTNVRNVSTHTLTQLLLQDRPVAYIRHSEWKDATVATIRKQQNEVLFRSDHIPALDNVDCRRDNLTKLDNENIISVPRTDNNDGDDGDDNLASVASVPDNNTQKQDYTMRMCADSEEYDRQLIPRLENQPSIFDQIKRFFQNQLDVDLLRIPRFLAVLVINGLCFAMIHGSKLFVIAMAKERGFSGELSLLLTVNACTDIPGRFIVAMIIDSKILKTQHTVMLCCLLSALGTCFYPLTEQYWSMMLVSAIMGMTAATSAYMALPIAIEVVGVQRMSKALGWYSFTMSLSTTVINPILGSIRDVTGSYDAVFYIAGGWIIALVLIYFIGYFIAEYSSRKNKRSAEGETNSEPENILLATGDNEVNENV